MTRAMVTFSNEDEVIRVDVTSIFRNRSISGGSHFFLWEIPKVMSKTSLTMQTDTHPLHCSVGKAIRLRWYAGKSRNQTTPGRSPPHPEPAQRRRPQLPVKYQRSP